MIAGLKTMVSRNPAQDHRASTPLELLFDLVFVVAVSRASATLHHFWAEAHFAQGLTAYAMGFFAIWWGWMNFTWFASAFDTDDWLYRITTLVQMAGALTVAAGVERAMLVADFGIVIVGYVIMRLAAVTQWVRAAYSDPAMRTTCMRYATGVVVVQALWILWGLFARGHLQIPLFLVIVLADLCIPALAEQGARTTWHPEHIAERYGLFTLIVLGESILASANSIIGGIDDSGAHTAMIGIAVAALIIVAAVWWIYFDQEQNCVDVSMRAAMTWGYSHYLIFGAAAALSAGFEIAVDEGLGKSHLSPVAAALTLTVPFAVYLTVTWLVLLQHRGDRLLNIAAPALTVASIAISPLTHALYWLAALAALTAGVVTSRHGGSTTAP